MKCLFLVLFVPQILANIFSHFQVFACVEGASGRLGVGGYLNVPSPRQITGLSTYVVRKVAVHSGGQHARALTADGKVFSWGNGEHGQLGHASTQ